VVTSTANWIAAIRARESRRADRLFDDPYAEALAGERGVAMLAASERASGGRSMFVPVRVRWFDDAVLGAVAGGVRQVALLGAGLDTRPYRLDLPATFAAKEPVLAGAVARCRRHTVAVDLATDWTGALRAAGFDPARPTLWLAEGLVFYLSVDQIHALLRRAGALSAAGSRFLADVMGTARFDGPLMARYREYGARHGIPPPFGTDDPAGLFAGGGWVAEAISAPGAPGANYGRFPEVAGGVRPGWPHLVVARPAARSAVDRAR
jgi:methyltransferase (TIGR00027 family)